MLIQSNCHKQTVLALLYLLLITSCGGEDEKSRIVIGNSNTLFALNELQYQDPFVVQVTDVDGNPASYATVKVKLKGVSYNKGYYQVTGESWNPLVTIRCANEDLNTNGRLDPAEDINGNGRLDPSNSATIAAHPTLIPTITAATGNNTIVTDEFGFGYFSLTFPKSEAVWSSIEITVSANSDEFADSAVYIVNLPVLLADVSNVLVSPPGGGLSPYGVAADCSDFN